VKITPSSLVLGEEFNSAIWSNKHHQPIRKFPPGKERRLQQGGRTDGPREARHDDFRSVGMIKPEQEPDRFRTGTNARRKW
jgi:hypothetical protein